MEKGKMFYYSSTEGYIPELPMQVKVLKKLWNSKEREAILVECEGTITAYNNTKYLVLVPKSLQGSIFNIQGEDVEFVYTIDGSDYIDSETIQLSNRLIMDWGAVTLSYDSAKSMQVTEDQIHL